jgi:septal ring factor EnvC (AmiA/AmiB activator)
MRRLILICALMLGAAAPAADLPRLEAEHRDEGVRARRLRADATAAAAEIAALDRRLRSLSADEGRDDVQLVSQRARLAELGRREGLIVAELAGERGRHGRLLTALQMMSRRPPPPLLVPAERAIDTARAAILMKAISPELQRRAQLLAARQAEVASIRRLAVLSSERLFTLESEQGDRRAEMETLAARKRALLAVLRAEAEAAERSTAALEARLRALGGRVQPVEAREATTSASPGPLGRPLPGPPVARFGGASDGWRWRADRQAVAAPAAAPVAYAGSLAGWGQVVILDLAPGWRAVIAGLDEVAVSAGARVAAGQTLGRSGPDGEIYLELRRDDQAIDPAPWLR